MNGHHLTVIRNDYNKYFEYCLKERDGTKTISEKCKLEDLTGFYCVIYSLIYHDAYCKQHKKYQIAMGVKDFD